MMRKRNTKLAQNLFVFSFLVLTIGFLQVLRTFITFAQGTVETPQQPELVVQMGHSESITSVAISKDDRYLVTGE